MILLSGRQSVGRNVKRRAESTQGRQGYKVQGSMVTKLLSLDCQHWPQFGSFGEESHNEGESVFPPSSALACLCLKCCWYGSKRLNSGEESKAHSSRQCNLSGRLPHPSPPRPAPPAPPPPPPGVPGRFREWALKRRDLGGCVPTPTCFPSASAVKLSFSQKDT